MGWMENLKMWDINQRECGLMYKLWGQLVNCLNCLVWSILQRVYSILYVIHKYNDVQKLMHV
jgi:hypothetical protein